MSTPRNPLLLACLGALLAGCVTNPQATGSGGASALMGTLGALGGGAAPLSLGVSAPAGGGNLIELLAQSIHNIDEAKEIEIGRQLSAILLGSKPLHKDMALQAYVNRLGRWISLQSARPDLPWTFMVLDDAGFNAFAAPGGYVFVTKGLIDAAQDEAELGGVLAHEIVHVVEKHHLKSLNKTAQTALAGQLLASQAKGALGSFVASQLVSMGKELYAKGLDRGDEYEADRKGVTLAARSGLDPFGLPALLQTLSAAKPTDPGYSLVLSTHPPAEQRMAALDTAMGNRFDALAGGKPVLISARVKGSAPPATETAPSAPAKPATKPRPIKKPAA